VPLPRKFMNFSSQNGVIWCILGVLFLRFICHMDYYCIKGKNKTLVKILGGHQHRTTPAGQILGVATPATAAALTPMRVGDGKIDRTELNCSGSVEARQSSNLHV